MTRFSAATTRTHHREAHRGRNDRNPAMSNHRYKPYQHSRAIGGLHFRANPNFLRPGEENFKHKPNAHQTLVNLVARAPPFDTAKFFENAVEVSIKQEEGNGSVTTKTSIPRISTWKEAKDGRVMELDRMAEAHASTAANLGGDDDGRENKAFHYIEYFGRGFAGHALVDWNNMLAKARASMSGAGGPMDQKIHMVNLKQEADRLLAIANHLENFQMEAVQRIVSVLETRMQDSLKDKNEMVEDADPAWRLLEQICEIVMEKEKMMKKQTSNQEEERDIQMNPYRETHVFEQEFALGPSQKIKDLVVPRTDTDDTNSRSEGKDLEGPEAAILDEAKMVEKKKDLPYDFGEIKMEEPEEAWEEPTQEKEPSESMEEPTQEIQEKEPSESMEEPTQEIQEKEPSQFLEDPIKETNPTQNMEEPICLDGTQEKEDMDDMEELVEEQTQEEKHTDDMEESTQEKNLHYAEMFIMKSKDESNMATDIKETVYVLDDTKEKSEDAVEFVNLSKEDENMDREGQTKRRKEDRNEEEDVMSAEDGMHEPSEKSPPRKRGRKKSKNKKKAPEENYKKSVPDTKWNKLVGPTQAVLEELDSDKNEILLYNIQRESSKIQLVQQYEEEENIFNCINCNLQPGLDQFDLLCPDCYIMTCNELKAIKEKAIMKDGILPRNHILSAIKMQDKADAINHYAIKFGPPGKIDLVMILLLPRLRSLERHQDQNGHINFKENEDEMKKDFAKKAALSWNDRIHQYNIYITNFLERKEKFESLKARVTQCMERMPQIDPVTMVRIVSILERIVEVITEIISILRKERKELTSTQPREEEEATGLFKILLNFSKSKNQFLPGQSCLGLIMSTLANELIFPPEAWNYPPRESFAKDMTDDEKEECIEFFKLINGISNLFWIRTEEDHLCNYDDDTVVDTQAIQPTPSFKNVEELISFFKVAEAKFDTSGRKIKHFQDQQTNHLDHQQDWKASFTAKNISRESSTAPEEHNSQKYYEFERIFSDNLSQVLEEKINQLREEQFDISSHEFNASETSSDIYEISWETAKALTLRDEETTIPEMLIVEKKPERPTFKPPLTAEQLAEVAFYDAIDAVISLRKQKPLPVDHLTFTKRIRQAAFEEEAELYKRIILTQFTAAVAGPEAHKMAEYLYNYIKAWKKPKDMEVAQFINILEQLMKWLKYHKEDQYSYRQYNHELSNEEGNMIIIQAQDPSIREQLLQEPGIARQPRDYVRHRIINLDQIQVSINQEAACSLCLQAGRFSAAHNHREEDCHSRHTFWPSQYGFGPNRRRNFYQNNVGNRYLFPRRNNNGVNRFRNNNNNNNNFNRNNNNNSNNFNRLNNNNNNNNNRNFNRTQNNINNNNANRNNNNSNNFRGRQNFQQNNRRNANNHRQGSQGEAHLYEEFSD